ncbi:hypothetical protein WJX73_009772 [Symbiochloris irregularis]|uniref:Radical SAM core domain-containing protein n=1 Tax=Symbiochloris irregularis TaxID=706552 RepID=A0AAW1P2X2_9CHLO
MVKKRKLSPQSVWDEAALESAFTEEDIKLFHISRSHKYLTVHPEAELADIPELPLKAQAILKQRFARFTSTVEQCHHSAAGDTTKLLIRLQDGLQVESVIMYYDTSARETDSSDGESVTGHSRATLCVSSQVGCQMGCTFCATGTMGLVADLTAGEILEQLVHALRVAPIQNVVFMGMGEPLNNYLAVRAAAAAMTDSKRFALRRSAVTISTVGVVPRILALADDLPGVSLALSLHAPTQELRQSIVPSAKAYKLDKLLAAVDTYQQKTKQKVFVEYVMLAGVNDQPEHARQLGALLQTRNVTLNLIPWNPIFSPSIDFSAPSPGGIATFCGIVTREFGVRVTVRREKGSDIASACGQLVINSDSKRCSSSSKPLRDIEDSAAPVSAR